MHTSFFRTTYPKWFILTNKWSNIAFNLKYKTEHFLHFIIDLLWSFWQEAVRRYLSRSSKMQLRPNSVSQNLSPISRVSRQRGSSSGTGLGGISNRGISHKEKRVLSFVYMFVCFYKKKIFFNMQTHTHTPEESCKWTCGWGGRWLLVRLQTMSMLLCIWLLISAGGCACSKIFQNCPWIYNLHTICKVDHTEVAHKRKMTIMHINLS